MAEEKKNPLIGAFRSPPPKEATKRVTRSMLSIRDDRSDSMKGRSRD